MLIKSIFCNTCYRIGFSFICNSAGDTSTTCIIVTSSNSSGFGIVIKGIINFIKLNSTSKYWC